jgi:hypothetical protein
LQRKETEMASKTYEQVKQNRQPAPTTETSSLHSPDKSARQSEFAVSEHGMNQESEHNKHNHPPKGAPKH